MVHHHLIHGLETWGSRRVWPLKSSLCLGFVEWQQSIPNQRYYYVIVYDIIIIVSSVILKFRNSD